VGFERLNQRRRARKKYAGVGWYRRVQKKKTGPETAALQGFEGGGRWVKPPGEIPIGGKSWFPKYKPMSGRGGITSADTRKETGERRKKKGKWGPKSTTCQS